MDILTIAILVLIAAGMVIYSLLPSKDSAEAVKRRLEGKRNIDEMTQIKEKAKQAATANLVKKATPMLTKLIMPVSDADRSALREKLIHAGYRQPQAQTVFLASKTAVGVFGAIAAAGIAGGLGYSWTNVAAAMIFGAGIGFIAPGMWLGSVTKRRQERIRGGLPDILDLMVVSVESGLALDAAIKRCGEEMAMVHPDVSDEFRIATRESQMGIPRAEALENMAHRVGIEEIGALVSVVTQAERFGTSVSKALRNQAESMRSKRRLAAEERAQKTAVKLMIPLVLFIFPAMGVVLAGPAGIQLMEAFSN